MKLKTTRTMTNAALAVGFAMTIMAAAYAEGSHGSAIDNARNVEPAAQGRSAEGNMGMAMPAHASISPTEGPGSAKHVERTPNGTSLTRATVGNNGGMGTQSAKDVTGEPARQ